MNPSLKRRELISKLKHATALTTCCGCFMRLAEDCDFARHQEDLTEELADPDKVAGAILINDPALLL